MTTEHPLVVEAADATLRGTLHLTPGRHPHPAVILLHGAGRGDRNSFPAIVEAFLGAGIAVATFDRRGAGESSGEPGMDIELWAHDAVAAFEAVVSHAAIDSDRVALWGHSNGAWVGARAAAMLPTCAALVLSGASAVTPGRAEAYRRTEDLRSFGVSESTLAVIHEAWSIIFDFLGSGLWDESRSLRLNAARQVIEADSMLASIPVPEFVRANPSLDSIPRFDRPPLSGDLGALASSIPWMGYDPIPSLVEATCPVLAVLAEHDKNCPPGESAARFASAAERRRAPLSVVVIPNASHSFTLQPRTDRDAAAPPSLKELLAAYVETMTTWLKQQLESA